MSGPTILIVAKSPIAGLAKTRLAKTIGDTAAARIAAAALLDTIEVCATLHQPIVIAMTGDLAPAEYGDEIAAAIAPHHVIQQRGDRFADRLVNAHTDAAHTDTACADGVIQVGMDTPQLSGDDLQAAADALLTHDAALGMAADGGWWILAVHSAQQARVLADVPMSTGTTGADTRAALERDGSSVATLTVLTDVDEWSDALDVARSASHTRFAREVAHAGDRVKVS